MKLLLPFLLLTTGLAFAEKYKLPEKGAVLGAYVEAGPLSEVVNENEVQNFEALVQREVAWVYFSNNWTDGNIEFPKANVEKCRQMNRIPYIRLMPWSEVVTRTKGDPLFTMDNFLKGKFDDQLIAWAKDAQKLDGPYIFEFGPEVNGDWFPWNGKWNGAGTSNRYGDPSIPDGPEKFRDVYKRVIDIFRKQGLTNVNWVLHLDTAKAPIASWNRASYYYPGDEYIDWIGLSVFGAQLPNHDWIEFLPKLKSFWPEIADIAKRKPVIISEMAVIEDKKVKGRKAQWLARALRTIETGLYPIKGVTYWNSAGWLEDGSADFRITSSDSSLESFKKQIHQEFWKNQKVSP